MKIINK